MCYDCAGVKEIMLILYINTFFFSLKSLFFLQILEEAKIFLWISMSMMVLGTVPTTLIDKSAWRT